MRPLAAVIQRYCFPSGSRDSSDCNATSNASLAQFDNERPSRLAIASIRSFSGFVTTTPIWTVSSDEIEGRPVLDALLAMSDSGLATRNKSTRNGIEGKDLRLVRLFFSVLP